MKGNFIIKPNSYYDSVTLMMINKEVSSLEGIDQAVVSMATDHNKEILKNVGLLFTEIETANANDLIIAAFTKDEQSYANMIDKVEQLLSQKKESSSEEYSPTTLDYALRQNPECNLVLISLPGAYAGAEAKRALEHNKSVMLFSDNVSIEEEIQLKEMAVSKGLLMMGPDCGTAIINNIPIAFANVISRGNIGIVGASGTGLQEVTTIIDKLGEGITHAIGTGGRDLSKGVGGKMMIQGIRALSSDPETKVIVLISKPPAQEVACRVLEELKNAKKPSVVHFIGGDAKLIESYGAVAALSLEDTAIKAAALARGDIIPGYSFELRDTDDLKIREEASKMSSNQKYIRGLYTGGTLCDETLKLLSKELGDVYSNIPLRPEMALRDVNVSKCHSFIDLGDDLFTVGRPHPMIDPSTRQTRLLQEAEDEEIAVVIMDFVLGYGSNQDPAGAMAPYILKAKEKAQNRGGYLSIVASVCGTDKDIQNLDKQIQTLKDLGVLIESSNARAARCALDIIKSLKGSV